MRLLVLGGTHFLGRHVVTAALERGHEVATFTRGVSGEPPEGVRALHGDRRLDLVVVPPEADALTGVRALRLAGLREDSGSPQRVLAAAGSRPRPEVVPLRGVRAG